MYAFLTNCHSNKKFFIKIFLIKTKSNIFNFEKKNEINRIKKYLSQTII